MDDQDFRFPPRCLDDIRVFSYLIDEKKLFIQELNPANPQALRSAMLPWHNLTAAGFSSLLLKPEEALSGVELGSLLNLLLNRLMGSFMKNSLLKSPFERD